MVSALRSEFDKQLAALNDAVLDMGNRARQAVAQAVDAYAAGNADLARDVIKGDEVINERRFAIEKQCYGLLATEQPVARDMRAIVSALIIVNELERVGDHGKKIARICLRVLEDSRPLPLGDIPRLSQLALAMLDNALHAYGTHNVEQARAVCQADDEVDALYRQTFNVVLSRMLEDPRLIGVGTHMLQVAHELERVGDRATNIGERVIFAATGALVDLNL
jgi:phosphate transport system protein